MKEMWQLESENYRDGEKSFNRFVNENGYLLNDDDEPCEVSYITPYEFVIDVSNLSAAQVYDLQDLMYTENEDVDAFVSGIYLLDGDDEDDKVSDYFIYRRVMSDDEFDSIFGVLKDYEKLGLSFIFASIGKSARVLTPIPSYLW